MTSWYIRGRYGKQLYWGTAPAVWDGPHWVENIREVVKYPTREDAEAQIVMLALDSAVQYVTDIEAVEIEQVGPLFRATEVPEDRP